MKHKLTTADIVRFMVAAFILGITLGMVVPDAKTLAAALPKPFTHAEGAR